MFIFIELIVAVVVLLVAGLWWWNTQGPAFEPVITMVIGSGVLLDVVRRIVIARKPGLRRDQKKEQHDDNVDVDDELPESSESNEANLSSTVFFYHRFSDAFPGVRDSVEFAPAVGVKRLKILLRDPLTFENDKGGRKLPVWWWRNGNMHISDFRVLRRKIVLLDHQELKLARVVAVSPGSYYQCFVYLECAPMKDTGLYGRTKESIEESVDYFGYARDEYALVNGWRKISREDYDDGSTVIWGKPRSLRDYRVELRCRYLTSYNVVIAPFHSPINNQEFEKPFREIMNDILRGKADVEDLVAMVVELPKNETHNG